MALGPCSEQLKTFFHRSISQNCRPTSLLVLTRLLDCLQFKITTFHEWILAWLCCSAPFIMKKPPPPMATSSRLHFPAPGVNRRPPTRGESRPGGVAVARTGGGAGDVDLCRQGEYWAGEAIPQGRSEVDRKHYRDAIPNSQGADPRAM